MIRSYEHKDYPMLCQWLSYRGIANPDPDFFSVTGFVSDESSIGFLFQTNNTRTAYIDHVAADPLCEKEKRDRSLDLLFSHLEHVAKISGARLVTALARLDAMKNRFQAHGFQPFGEYTIFFKLLKKDELCPG